PRVPGGRVGEGLVDYHLPFVHGNLHADAEILGALPTLHVAKFGGVEKIRMRIEGLQHAWYGAFVNGAFGGDRVGEVLFHQSESLRHRPDPAGQLIFRSGSRANANHWSIEEGQPNRADTEQGDN